MKKEMLLETNDEAVDLGRRSMMGRLGLVASVACAAPVLLTISTSAQANHKKAEKSDQACNDNGSNRNGNAKDNVCQDNNSGGSGW
jgi:hypothetical protein